VDRTEQGGRGGGQKCVTRGSDEQQRPGDAGSQRRRGNGAARFAELVYGQDQEESREGDVGSEGVDQVSRWSDEQTDRSPRHPAKPLGDAGPDKAGDIEATIPAMGQDERGIK
jgi:hypothetical protein